METLLPDELWLRVLAAALHPLPRGRPRLLFLWGPWRRTCALFKALATPRELAKLGAGAWDQPEWSVLLLAAGCEQGDGLAGEVRQFLRHFQLEEVRPVVALTGAQVDACAEVDTVTLSFSQLDPIAIVRCYKIGSVEDIAQRSLSRLFGDDSKGWTAHGRGIGTLGALDLPRWPRLRRINLEFSGDNVYRDSKVLFMACFVQTVQEVEVQHQKHFHLVEELLELVKTLPHGHEPYNGLRVNIHPMESTLNPGTGSTYNSDVFSESIVELYFTHGTVTRKVVIQTGALQYSFSY